MGTSPSLSDQSTQKRVFLNPFPSNAERQSALDEYKRQHLFYTEFSKQYEEGIRKHYQEIMERKGLWLSQRIFL